MNVASVHIAKDRLRNLLIADRLQCTPDISERLTTELYQTISKYIELKPDELQIQITHSDIHIKLTGEGN
ncbi:MAG: cell division topological specificity factor MinE [Candidatus Ruminococcus intestinipullorum]|nr:cell division topological specificity factor MinE [Candidatus Ruminococcus intestinipullorum]